MPLILFFGETHDTKANLDRLIRSLRKWRDNFELPYSAEDEEYLRLRSSE